MKKWLSKVIIFTIMIIGLCSTATNTLNVKAADAPGITIQVKEGYNVSLQLYQVAKLDGGKYTLTDAFSTTGIDFNNMTTAADSVKCVETLTEHVKTAAPAVDFEGTTSGSELKLSLNADQIGIYLVMQSLTPQDRLEIAPYLISVPYWDQNTLIYDVLSLPKGEVIPIPSEPGSEPESEPASAPESEPASVPESEPGTEPEGTVPVDSEVPGRLARVLGAMRGVLGVRAGVRTGDDSMTFALGYAAVIAVMIAVIVFVVIRRNKKSKDEE